MYFVANLTSLRLHLPNILRRAAVLFVIASGQNRTVGTCTRILAAVGGIRICHRTSAYVLVRPHVGISPFSFSLFAAPAFISAYYRLV